MVIIVNMNGSTFDLFCAKLREVASLLKVVMSRKRCKTLL